MVAKGSRRGRLILIDAHSLIYRAFFALPPTSTSRGEGTTAAYGFTSMLPIALVPRGGITDTTVYGPDQDRQRYGLEPRQLIDFQALRGDTSDNIPGVPGVGEKTAAKLVADFGSVEALLERLEELPEGRVKTALTEHRDDIMLGKRLVTIKQDLPVELDLEGSRWTRYDGQGVRKLFDELEFRQLLSRFPLPDAIAIPTQATLAFEPVREDGGPLIVSDDASAT